MTRLSLTLASAALVTTLCLGCGGQAAPEDAGPATFENPDFGITFEYPSSFETVDDLTFNRAAGSAAQATAGVALDESNLLGLQRFENPFAVTDENLDEVVPEADMLFSQLAGEPVKGIETEVAGLPAIEYDIPLQEPEEGETRVTVFFDGETQYLLNCQSTPEQREAVEAACDMALETLETT